MPYSNINSTITAADLALILGYFVQVEGKLTFGVNLTTQENRKLLKFFGKKGSQFLYKALKMAEANPALLPSFISITALRADIQLSTDLENIELKAQQVLERITDTKRAAREEALQTTIRLYNIWRAMDDSTYPGITSIVEELKPFFPRTGKKKKVLSTEP